MRSTFGRTTTLALLALALFAAAPAPRAQSAASTQAGTGAKPEDAKPASAKAAGDKRPRAEVPPRSKVIDAARLVADVRTLSADDMEGRKTGTAGGAKARAYVVAAFRRIGLEHYGADYLQPFAFTRGEKSYEGANVVGFVRGRSGAAPVLVVSAHYDHLGVVNGEIYNGADDNASGVAVLLAVADYFSRHRPAHTVVFAAFDGEELGLQGSRYFVKSPPLDLKSVALDLNMDMVSRNDRGEIYAAGALPYPFLRPYLEETAKGAGVRLLIGHDDPKTGHDDWTMQSDQGSFHTAGVPFVYFGVEDHADYHRPTDDFEKINQTFFVHAAETVLAFARLAERDLDRIAAQAAHK